ncbi:MAG: hypothetical protein KAJ07_04790 [Planctomycetes bacterium]|nr:hypothetical protein [Planctomycetota bacterium]
MSEEIETTDENQVSAEAAAAMVTGPATEPPPAEVSPFEIFADIGSGQVPRALDESAFTTLQEVIDAGDDDIKAVKGIGPATVRKMRDVLANGDKPKKAPAVEAPPSDEGVTVGPAKPIEGGEVEMRALGNYNYMWKGERYLISVGAIISKYLPQDLIDEMVSRGEAGLVPGK